MEVSYEVSVGCCNYENIHAEVAMKYSYWGDAATAEMNDGDNPKNISKYKIMKMIRKAQG